MKSACQSLHFAADHHIFSCEDVKCVILTFSELCVGLRSYARFNLVSCA